MRIDHAVIGHDYPNILAYVFLDEFFYGAGFGVFGLDEFQVTATLSHADYWSLVFPAFPMTFTSDLAADVRLIDFHDARQEAAVLHGFTDAVGQVPRCLVCD